MGGAVTVVHAEKETLLVDVNLPGHEDRVTTALFTRTRKQLVAREGDRCFICNRTPAESGHPNESHHVWIERCLADGVDWTYFREYILRLEAELKRMADYVRAHPQIRDIMDVVDDQTINGMLLCKEHHTDDGKDVACGIHTIPFPLWQFQAYARADFLFTTTEKIEHADDPEPLVAA